MFSKLLTHCALVDIDSFMKTIDQSNTPGPQSGEILKQVLQEKKKKNHSYSLRAAARDLGVTHGYLSLILSGKKFLNFHRAIQFSQSLKMDEMRTSLFLRCVALESMKDSACRIFLENSFPCESVTSGHEFATLELDRFRILSDWYHIAVLDLTLLKQFKPDPAWIASELGITIDHVKNAAARLARLGLLEISKGQWIKTNAKLAIPTTYSDHAVREFHQQMIEKATEALNSPSSEDFAAREISAITFPINPDKVPEAKRKVEKFKREMLKFLGSGDCTALYQMNIQLFPLSKSKVQNSKKNIGVK